MAKILTNFVRALCAVYNICPLLVKCRYGPGRAVAVQVTMAAATGLAYS